LFIPLVTKKTSEENIVWMNLVPQQWRKTSRVILSTRHEIKNTMGEFRHLTSEKNDLGQV